jgi:hypothetical protein
LSGTVSGGLKAKKTIIERHGSDWYKKIGRIGGHNSNSGGFGSTKVGKDGLTGLERASKAGRIGGLKSKRGPAKKKKEENVQEKEN